MKVFSQLIEQVGIGVRPHIGSLLEQIPSLWSEAEGDNSSLLQCVIITTLTHVVNSLGALSTELHPFLLPIIQYSIDMNSVCLNTLLINTNYYYNVITKGTTYLSCRRWSSIMVS